MLTIEEKTQRNWAMAAHLAALAICFVAIPLGNIWGPLIVWLWKRHEVPGVDEHGKAALNFHISIVLYLLIGAIVLGVPLLILTFVPFLGLLTIPLLWLMGVVGSLIILVEIILTIIAAVKASDGSTFNYPLSLKLIK